MSRGPYNICFWSQIWEIIEKSEIWSKKIVGYQNFRKLFQPQQGYPMYRITKAWLWLCNYTHSFPRADWSVRAGFSGWSVYPKLDFSLKINISLHNWASKKICSIRYTQYVHISFWTLRKWLYKRRKNGRRSRPPSAADFLCRFGVLNTIISWESKMKYAHIEYI